MEVDEVTAVPKLRGGREYYLLFYQVPFVDRFEPIAFTHFTGSCLDHWPSENREPNDDIF